MLNLLLRNKPILEKLKAEIRDNIKREEGLVIENLGKLQYLESCVLEALRIFPPVPVGLLRVVPPGGSDIDGRFIPEGVSLILIPAMPIVETH